MKKLSVIILVSILSFSLMSCSDDDSNEEPNNSITDGEWKLVGLILNGNDVTSSQLNECNLRNTYLFREDNTFIFTSHNEEQNSDSCTSDTESGVWRDVTKDADPALIAAFDGKDIEDDEERLNFRIVDGVLRETVYERNSDGTRETFFYLYEK
ncbi:lipocalin family protein [Aquimarina sp. W85]|uniref:lipocalin family protein n=1 Tax=Aquimarina rhodophyticola TaxID=3342246 RepID=UPI00366ADDE0